MPRSDELNGSEYDVGNNDSPSAALVAAVWKVCGEHAIGVSMRGEGDRDRLPRRLTSDFVKGDIDDPTKRVDQCIDTKLIEKKAGRSQFCVTNTR